VNREVDPSVDHLIPADTPTAERQRLQQVHELLLRADPPPELSPELERGPNLAATFGRRRHVVKQRAMLLIAAAIVLVLVFTVGYVVGDGRNNTSATPVRMVNLKGTSQAPRAQATLQVWRAEEGNWPMTLNVVDLPKLPPRQYYYVYLVRQGKIVAPCGIFRITGHRALTIKLSAPYPLRRGDSWVVTRPGPAGTEPGQTVLRPVKA
jgi:hypothetical protein